MFIPGMPEDFAEQARRIFRGQFYGMHNNIILLHCIILYYSLSQRSFLYGH